MLNKILAGLAILAGLYLGHVYVQHEAIKQAVKATTVKLNTEYNIKLQASQKAAKEVTEALQADADKTRDKKDETIQSINNKLSVALNELRNRPKRPTPTDHPQDTSNSQACTARELYYEDGEFLTREAARAETILVERDYYYQQYEEVRSKVNGIAK